MGKITTTSVAPVGDKPPAVQSGSLIKRDVEKVMVVIDHSGSMDADFGGQTRQEAVCEAVWAIVDASSRAVTGLGLIGFDTAPELMSAVTDKFSQIKGGAARLHPRGGTYYGPALKMAMEQDPNRIILLSDGEASDKTEAIAMAKVARARNIKIDTVAVGDRGVTLLQEISEITGGVYTFCDNVTKLTDTFLKLETRARLQLEHKT